MTKVNKRKITKTMCYNLVNTKRTEVLKEKHIPFRDKMFDKIKTSKRVLIEEVVSKNKIEQIVKQSGRLCETLEAIRDDLDYTYYIQPIIENLKRFSPDNVYHTLGNSIDTRNADVERMREAIEDDKDKYIEEFDKINNHLKSLKTGGQCYDFLKEIGFDVSFLEEQAEKYELSPVEVNKELLGLPEVVSK